MRLIDADELKKAMDRYWGTCQRIRKPRNGETAVFLDVRATVEKQPTIDAVPVIRCKDCVHWDCDDSETYCGEHGIFNTDMNSFCSYAKRKEE